MTFPLTVIGIDSVYNETESVGIVILGATQLNFGVVTVTGSYVGT